MNPNPLLALNHFTVPCSFTDLFLLYYLGYLVLLEPPSAENKKGSELFCTRSPFKQI